MNNIIYEESRLKRKVANKKGDCKISILFAISLLFLFVAAVLLTISYGDAIVCAVATSIVGDVMHNLCMMTLLLVVAIIVLVSFSIVISRLSDDIFELKSAKNDLALCQRQIEFELAKLKNNTEDSEE